MTDLSDRRHNAFNNPAKMASRAGNLRVLREAACLRRERLVTINLDIGEQGRDLLMFYPSIIFGKCAP